MRWSGIGITERRRRAGIVNAASAAARRVLLAVDGAAVRPDAAGVIAGAAGGVSAMSANIDPEAVMAAVANAEPIGFCTACGAQADGVEPDACSYRCEECGEDAVFGAEEVIFAL